MIEPDYTHRAGDLIFHIPRYFDFGKGPERVGTIDLSLKRLLMEIAKHHRTPEAGE